MFKHDCIPLVLSKVMGIKAASRKFANLPSELLYTREQNYKKIIVC